MPPPSLPTAPQQRDAHPKASARPTTSRTLQTGREVWRRWRNLLVKFERLMVYLCWHIGRAQITMVSMLRYRPSVFAALRLMN